MPFADRFSITARALPSGWLTADFAITVYDDKERDHIDNAKRAVELTFGLLQPQGDGFRFRISASGEDGPLIDQAEVYVKQLDLAMPPVRGEIRLADARAASAAVMQAIGAKFQDLQQGGAGRVVPHADGSFSLENRFVAQGPS